MQVRKAADDPGYGMGMNPNRPIIRYIFLVLSVIACLVVIFGVATDVSAVKIVAAAVLLLAAALAAV